MYHVQSGTTWGPSGDLTQTASPCVPLFKEKSLQFLVVMWIRPQLSVSIIRYLNKTAKSAVLGLKTCGTYQVSKFLAEHVCIFKHYLIQIYIQAAKTYYMTMPGSQFDLSWGGPSLWAGVGVSVGQVVLMRMIGITPAFALRADPGSISAFLCQPSLCCGAI